MGYFIFILVVIALIYLIKRFDQTDPIIMENEKPGLPTELESNGTSVITSPIVVPNSITSHPQRYEDRRLIERRRIHHNRKELHKVTQIKNYERKKDECVVGTPYFSGLYLKSRHDESLDGLEEKWDFNRYENERNSTSFDDIDCFEYDKDSRVSDYDYCEQDRFEYEDTIYQDRDNY
ncbi:hypothetical protein [Niallia sp. Krafla_26]|uniref:hypothetical protein n=1 Tax=Niallia sp. Krafla_26 TaxID=3064703 RepID=UPI003D17D29A